ncbi:hypothetical protein [Lonsdalea populi]|uniref:hypothetical protein n=1 Tax=Lonsdalea TaxID=1082702 RepID=UPI003F62BD68
MAEWGIGGLAVPFTVSRRSQRQGLRVLARWRSATPPDCFTLRRAGHGSGQFRPSNRSTIMSQLSFFSFDDALLVRDAQGRYLPASVN